VLAERVSTVTAYEREAAGYDARAGGGLFAADEPVVAGYLDSRAPGAALDTACGTGHFAEFLARRGHQVVGVDNSPDMLADARRRVPDGPAGNPMGLQVRGVRSRLLPGRDHRYPCPQRRSATGSTGRGR
jgi:SAM-dependent methyltransferase